MGACLQSNTQMMVWSHQVILSVSSEGGLFGVCGLVWFDFGLFYFVFNTSRVEERQWILWKKMFKTYSMSGNLTGWSPFLVLCIQLPARSTGIHERTHNHYYDRTIGDTVQCSAFLHSTVWKWSVKKKSGVSSGEHWAASHACESVLKWVSVLPEICEHQSHSFCVRSLAVLLKKCAAVKRWRLLCRLRSRSDALPTDARIPGMWTV